MHNNNKQVMTAARHIQFVCRSGAPVRSARNRMDELRAAIDFDVPISLERQRYVFLWGS